MVVPDTYITDRRTWTITMDMNGSAQEEEEMPPKKKLKIQPEVLAFLKRTKKNKNKSEPSKDSSRVISITENCVSDEDPDVVIPYPSEDLISQIVDKKGTLDDLVEAANEILKGRGKVNFVAVKGSGVVAKLNDGELNPIPQNTAAFSTDEERYSKGEGKKTMVTFMKNTDNQDRPILGKTPSSLVMIQRPFKCTRCNVHPFQSKAEIEFHVSCHPATGYELHGYQCPVSRCKLNRRVYSRLIEHIAIKHPQIIRPLLQTETVLSVYGQFQCPMENCDWQFLLKRSLHTHIKTMHENKLTCIYCGVTFERISRPSFKLHEEKCQGMEYQCMQCSYKSNTKKKIEQHTLVHTGDGFKCELCGKVFATRGSYKSHMIVHDDNQPKFRCSICDVFFPRRDALKKHCRRLHDESTKRLQCPHCKYESKMTSDMNKHILMVHRKIYHCAVCDFKTNSRKQWREHEQYHKPEKVYSCPYTVCYFKAEQYSELHDHLMDVHKIRAKHQCPICCKYFKKRTHLVRHLVSHTGEKVYRCAECTAAFKSHSSYYRHTRKTGHDEGREGILSVPQNVVIEFDDNTAKMVVEQHNENIQQQLNLALAYGQSSGVINPQNNMNKVQMMCVDVHGTLHAVQDQSLMNQFVSHPQDKEVINMTEVVRFHSRAQRSGHMFAEPNQAGTEGPKPITSGITSNESGLLQLASVLPQENNSHGRINQASTSYFLNDNTIHQAGVFQVVKSFGRDETIHQKNEKSVTELSKGQEAASATDKSVLHVLKFDDSNEITFLLNPNKEVGNVSDLKRNNSAQFGGNVEPFPIGDQIMNVHFSSCNPQEKSHSDTQIESDSSSNGALLTQSSNLNEITNYFDQAGKFSAVNNAELLSIDHKQKYLQTQNIINSGKVNVDDHCKEDFVEFVSTESSRGEAIEMIERQNISKNERAFEIVKDAN